MTTTIGAETGNRRGSRSLASYLPTVARVFFGLLFVVMGLNGFLHFLPMPSTAMPPGLIAFTHGLEASGYMVPLIFGTQVIAGALLLANRFVPLALAMLAPVIVNIVLFHAFLQPAGLPMAVLVVVIEIYLARVHRDAFRGVLAARPAR